MKSFWALILIVFSISPVIAQQTDVRNVGGFSGVKTAEGVNVYLKQGDKEQVRVEVTGTDPSNVLTEVSGSYLKIHMKEGRFRDVDAKVYVTYVSLDKLSATSAGSIYSETPIQGRSINIQASSAGAIEVTVDAEAVNVSSSSAGEVELRGKAKKLTADVSSAGEVDAYDLEAEIVQADASSGGSMKVNVTDALTAHASSAGSIRYRGNPDRSNTNSSSGGSVRKSN